MTEPEAKPPGHRRALAGAFLLMMGGRIVGAAISPMLLAHAPISLLFLSPVIAHLVVVAALSSPLPYYAVVVPISIAHCMLGYFLGRAEGPRIVDFLVRRGVASEARLKRLLTPLRISAPLLVFLIPGPIVCALGGASATPPRTFILAIAGSQALWAFLCRIFGESVLAGIATMRGEIVRYALPATLVTSAIAIIIHFYRARQRRARSGEP